MLPPTDRYGDVQDKVLIYLKAGVAVIWIVDPLARNVTIYRPGSPPELVRSPALLQDASLPGLSIPLGDIFARLPIAEDPQPRIQE